MAADVAVDVRSLVGLKVAYPSETLTSEVLSLAGLARCYHFERRWRSGRSVEFQFERCASVGRAMRFWRTLSVPLDSVTVTGRGPHEGAVISPRTT